MDPYDAVTTGLAELEGYDVDPISFGAVKETYHLQGDDADHIIQVAVPGDDRVRLAAALYDRVADATSIPTPDIIDTGWEHDTVPYMVMERVPGKNIEQEYGEMDPERIDAIAAEAGAYLGEAHATIDLEGYGYLDADELAGTDDDWRGFLDGLVSSHVQDLNGTAFDPEGLIYRADRQWTDHREAVPEQPEASIVHNDYRPGNLLVAGDTITTVLDWDNAYAGDALFDYVMAEESFTGRWDSERDEEVRVVFRSAYTDHASVEEGRLQDLYRMVSRLSDAKAWQWLGAHGHAVPDEQVQWQTEGLERAVEALEDRS